MGGLVPTEALLKDGVELELDIPFDCDFDLAPETCQPNAFVIKRIDSVNASLSHGADTREVIMSFEAPNSRKVVKHYGVKLEVRQPKGAPSGSEPQPPITGLLGNVIR